MQWIVTFLDRPSHILQVGFAKVQGTYVLFPEWTNNEIICYFKKKITDHYLFNGIAFVLSTFFLRGMKWPVRVTGDTLSAPRETLDGREEMTSVVTKWNPFFLMNDMITILGG